MKKIILLTALLSFVLGLNAQNILLKNATAAMWMQVIPLVWGIFFRSV